MDDTLLGTSGHQAVEMRKDRVERARLILERLIASYPDAKCALNFKSPEELLVATILSAQCTDAMVNRITPSLFATFPVPEGLAAAPLRSIERIIRPCGYFRQKAKYIKGCCRMLIERFGGKVPMSMSDLLQLPGVARKTANVVLSVGFSINEGVAVDTHVARISKRLGLVSSTRPDKIEEQLMHLYPREQWGKITDVMIAHGRAVCSARKPMCDVCPVEELCPSSIAGKRPLPPHIVKRPSERVKAKGNRDKARS